VIAVMVN